MMKPLIPEQLRNPDFRFIKVKKGMKEPLERGWPTKANYPWNNPELTAWIDAGNNYGVVGGFGGLQIIDHDDLEVQQQVEAKLPETFTVETGSRKGLFHKFYICDEPKSFDVELKGEDGESRTLANVQGSGKQVVGPGSVHPDGQTYRIVHDVPIASIKIEEIQKVFAPWKIVVEKKKKVDWKTIGSGFSRDQAIEEIKAHLPLTTVLLELGSQKDHRGFWYCPMHNDIDPADLSVDDELGLGYCWVCKQGVDIIKLWRKVKDVDFRTAKTELAALAGVDLAAFDILPATTVNVMDDVFKGNKRGERGHGVHWNTLARLYEVSLGPGSRPIYLVTRGKKEFPLGDMEICLGPLPWLDDEQMPGITTYPQLRVLFDVCKKRSIKVSEMDKDNIRDEMTNALKEQHEDSAFFFETVAPVNRSFFENLADPATHVKKWLACALKKDPVLQEIFLGALPKLDINQCKPKYVMPFSPHGFIVTRTKTSKSSDAEVIGEVVERPTIAGVLGFATAKKKHPGKLHKLDGLLGLDEFQDEPEEDHLGKLHTVMEVGTTEIARGRRVRIKSWGIIHFYGNPKDLEQENAPADYFKRQYLYITIKLLRKISGNLQALGSRIGNFYFNPEAPQVSGKGVSLPTRERYEAYIHSLQHYGKPSITRLLLEDDIRDWMQKPWPKKFKETVAKIIDDVKERDFKEFMRGQLGAYRHIRGWAVRRAWIDFFPEFLSEKPPEHKEVIKAAERHLAWLINAVLIPSYKRVAHLLEEYTAKILAAMLRGAPQHRRYLVYCIARWLQEKESHVQIGTMEEVGRYWKDLAKAFAEKGKDLGRYGYWSRIEQDMTEADERELENYGISPGREGATRILTVNDPELAQQTVIAFTLLTELTFTLDGELRIGLVDEETDTTMSKSKSRKSHKRGELDQAIQLPTVHWVKIPRREHKCYGKCGSKRVMWLDLRIGKYYCDSCARTAMQQTELVDTNA